MKYLSLFIIAVLTISCSKTNMPAEQDPMPKTYKYLALGDSYTIGTSIPASKNFPNQLIDSLKTMGYQNTRFDIKATNGWTTSDLLSGIESANFKNETYNLVTLLIGVNNQYRGIDITIFEKEFKVLIDKAKGFVGDDLSKIIILSIPDYSVTPFIADPQKSKVAADILRYNELTKNIASQYDITYIDITPISQTAKDDLSLIANDHLHPSEKMYALWVHKMLEDAIIKLDK